MRRQILAGGLNSHGTKTFQRFRKMELLRLPRRQFNGEIFLEKRVFSVLVHACDGDAFLVIAGARIENLQAEFCLIVHPCRIQIPVGNGDRFDQTGLRRIDSGKLQVVEPQRVGGCFVMFSGTDQNVIITGFFRGERFAEFFPLHIGVDHDRFRRPRRIDLENSEVNLFARVGASNFPFKVIGRIGFQLKFLGENIVIFAIGIRQFEGVFTAVVSSGIQLKRNEVEAQIGIGPQVTYQGKSIRPQLEGAVEGEGGRI